MSGRVDGIVLAAGTASRMGRTKQLLPFRGRTVLECVVDAALASPLERVVVVLGHEAERLRALLADRDVDVVVNPDYEAGQGGSTSAGVRALDDDVDAVVFLLGDQPLVSPETVEAVVDAWRAQRAPIVLPVYEGRRGNPALFDRETFPGLRALRPEQGARTLFERYADRVLRVPVDDPAVHLDLDTLEDYERLVREHGGS